MNNLFPNVVRSAMDAQKLFAFLIALGMALAALLIVDLVSDGLLRWIFSVQPWGIEAWLRILVFALAATSLAAAGLIHWRQHARH